MYLFALAYDDDIDNTLYFPLTIDVFKTTIKSLNKTVDIVSGEQMTIVKGIPLRQFDIKVLLPKDKVLVGNENVWQPPITYLARIREFKANKKPLRFIVLRPQEDGTELFEGNLLVTLEEYTVEENAGEEGDFYITIKLKEYVPIQAKKLVTTDQKNSQGQTIAKEEPQRTAKEPAKSYTVKSGDTLWQIAQRELGDGSKYTEIASKNNISNPNNLQVGQVLKL